jgi:hypothetical protein
MLPIVKSVEKRLPSPGSRQCLADVLAQAGFF